MRRTRMFMVDPRKLESPEKVQAEVSSIIRMLTDEETTKLAEAALLIALKGSDIPLSMYGAIGRRMCEHANIVLWPNWASVQKGDNQ